MRGFFSRVISDPKKTKFYCVIMLLLALILGGVLLAPMLTRPARTERPEEPSTVVLYTDGTLGDVPGPYFPEVAENGYDKAAFAETDGFKSYESGGLRAKVGVDVSVHQGEIDWTAVAGSGVEYAMIRVGRRGYTEGGIVQDSTFQQNIQGALDAGLPVGVYFFSQAVSVAEAEEEAEQVLQWIKDYEITYPVVFDWEIINDADARTNQVDGETLSALTAAFCEKIRQAGYHPAVYAGSQMVLRGLNLSAIKDYDLWLVEYRDVPTFYYGFQMWQYTGSGAVDGIQGNVDLNLCFKEY